MRRSIFYSADGDGLFQVEFNDLSGKVTYDRKHTAKAFLVRFPLFTMDVRNFRRFDSR